MALPAADFYGNVADTDFEEEFSKLDQFNKNQQGLDPTTASASASPTPGLQKGQCCICKEMNAINHNCLTCGDSVHALRCSARSKNSESEYECHSCVAKRSATGNAQSAKREDKKEEDKDEDKDKDKT